ncbi:TetR/AcrR family transcriptional regulator [Frankia canadensis]|uniref:TetR/AcrR family transcriptional regulator n=1 Tax=Frankia canadensis TaxID=1836972 RepID=UPI001FAFAAB8|nr:TetR/AcrR family transcriptional regulator [Frankia canadensis]
MRPAAGSTEGHPTHDTPACRPKLSPDLLARAAIAIADADGLAAVSMRRLASSLGVGTMTLYYHVRDKDELLNLVWDEFMGEHLLDEIPADWRTALTEIAQRTRESYQRHPWALQVVARPARGPNKLRHIEQYLTIASRITDDPDEQLRIIHSVGDLVVGCTLRELSFVAYPAPAEREPARPLAAIDAPVPAEVLVAEPLTAGNVAVSAGRQPRPDFGALASSEELPRLRNVWTNGCMLRAPRFERALGWLLDGIEAAHPAAASSASSRMHPKKGA